MKLVRKDDHEVRIVATLETLVGTARLYDDDPAELGEDGTLHLHYAGETEVDWDTQETQTSKELATKGQRLFEDENGAILVESEIELIEDQPEE